jgi:hypothetical protein
VRDVPTSLSSVSPARSRTRPQEWLRSRLLGIGTALVLLAGCGGGAHPGSAAVVNGASIPDSQVTHVVDAFCSSVVAQQRAPGGNAQNVPVPYLRRLLLGYLVAFHLADDYFHAHGLTVTPAAVDRLGQPPTQPGLTGLQQSRRTGFLKAYQRYAFQLSTIGAHLKNRSVTSLPSYDKSTQQAGQIELAKWAARQHISVDPSFGVFKNLTIAPRSGSLSVAQSSFARRLAQLGSAQTITDSTGITLPRDQICGGTG